MIIINEPSLIDNGYPFELSVETQPSGEFSKGETDNTNETCPDEITIDSIELKTSLIGETIFFGTYEQDNNLSNGKEDIEWLVLDVIDNKALLLSAKTLDCCQYNSSLTDVTWENCSLRKWLNETFLNEAFTLEDQENIDSTVVSADKNPEFNTDPGDDTTDKVFLLSIDEVKKYFENNKARICAPTAFNDAQGALGILESNGEGCSCWWLRSPGHEQYMAADVDEFGLVELCGSDVDYDNISVRPAMWINMEFGGVKLKNNNFEKAEIILREAEELNESNAINKYSEAFCLKEYIVESKKICKKYKAAIMLFKNSEPKIEAEIKIKYCLEKIEEEKSAAEDAAELFSQYKTEKLENLKETNIGDIVYFGKYEQNNGIEDIKWLILEVKDNKALLLSYDVLDSQRFHCGRGPITWECCSLRSWLNDIFFNEAFTSKEQEKIQRTIVSADWNPKFCTDPGNITADKVFLLSIDEANRYFSTDEARKCAPTAYAKSRGVLTSFNSHKTESGSDTCSWWLRSPGFTQFCALSVSSDGSVFLGGASFDKIGGIRPAVWIDLVP